MAKERGTSAPCPICASTPCDFYIRKDGYDLFQCRACAHLFVWPLPSETDLKRVYSFDAGYQRPSGGDELRPITPEPRFIRALDVLESGGERGRILDVGCASGAFLTHAKARGWDCVGVEFSSDSARLTRLRGFPVIEGHIFDVDATKYEFDAIHMAEVVEHVPDPIAFLCHARRLLKPGGQLYLTTPNTDSFWSKSTYMVSRLFGVPWCHATPPHHLHQFGIASLAQALDRSGFRAASWDFTPPSLSYDLGETHVRRDLLAALRGRNMASIAVCAARLGATAATYIPLFALNRLLSGRSKDAQMQVCAIAN